MKNLYRLSNCQTTYLNIYDLDPNRPLQMSYGQDYDLEVDYGEQVCANSLQLQNAIRISWVEKIPVIETVEAVEAVEEPVQKKAKINLDLEEPIVEDEPKVQEVIPVAIVEEPITNQPTEEDISTATGVLDLCLGIGVVKKTKGGKIRVTPDLLFDTRDEAILYLAKNPELVEQLKSKMED